MFVLKDIMANGYRAGGNVKFFGKTADDIKKGLQSRLNFDDVESDAAMPSMLAFPMTAEQYESGAMDTVMSVTTRLLPWEVTNGSHNSFPGGADMQKLYERLIGLRAIHFGEDLRASENMEYMSQVTFACSPLVHQKRYIRFDMFGPSRVRRARPTTRSASSAPTASLTQ